MWLVYNCRIIENGEEKDFWSWINIRNHQKILKKHLHSIGNPTISPNVTFQIPQSVLSSKSFRPYNHTPIVPFCRSEKSGLLADQQFSQSRHMSTLHSASKLTKTFGLNQLQICPITLLLRESPPGKDPHTSGFPPPSSWCIPPVLPL